MERRARAEQRAGEAAETAQQDTCSCVGGSLQRSIVKTSTRSQSVALTRLTKPLLLGGGLLGDEGVPLAPDTSQDESIALALGLEAEQDSAGRDVGVPDWDMMASETPREIPALALLDFPLSESVQGAFQQIFGDAWRDVVFAQWSIDWEGWDELVVDVTAMRAGGEDIMSTIILDRMATELRRFVR